MNSEQFIKKIAIASLTYVMAMLFLTSMALWSRSVYHYDDKAYRFCMDTLGTYGTSSGQADSAPGSILTDCETYLKIPVAPMPAPIEPRDDNDNDY